MVGKEVVPGDGWLSDDSSFYGDEDEQDRLRELARNFTGETFAARRERDLNSALSASRAMPPSPVIDLASNGEGLRKAISLQDGNPNAPDSKLEITSSREIGYGNTKTPTNQQPALGRLDSPSSKPTTTCTLSGWLGIDRKAMEKDRIARLGKRRRSASPEMPSKMVMKPSTSTTQPVKNEGIHLHNIYEGRPDAWQLNEPVNRFLQRLPPVTTNISVCPWIWAANPYPQGQFPLTDGRVDFIPRGQLLLQKSLEQRDKIRSANSTKPKGAIFRLLNQEAESLKQRLAELAEQTNVLSGKWMLFPGTDDLERVWKTVVEGTITNRLGFLAKVATDEGSPSDRLICVYTNNFRDTEDVLRVLKELVVLGLVKSGRGIYYKSDAYTHLNLYGGNCSDFGLQASAYSSQKMLASANFTQKE